MVGRLRHPKCRIAQRPFGKNRNSLLIWCDAPPSDGCPKKRNKRQFDWDCIVKCAKYTRDL